MRQFSPTCVHRDMSTLIIQVSRSLAACDGAILVVDAAQGVEAQTLANVYLALDHDLDVVPVLNKIDLPSADPQRVIEEIEDVIGIEAEDAPQISAKTGLNVDQVLEEIVAKVPAPTGDPKAPLQALIFDSLYDAYKGVIVFCRIKEGTVKKGTPILMMATGAKAEVVEVGYFGAGQFIPCEELSADIFIEKFLVEPKHIEVQILADEHGNVMHLGERDCSLQRRYQKVVEFAPAWSVPKDTIEALRADAVKIAKYVGYINAGTVEFLVDKNSGQHYFIEMNPRIQVEHTVTEMVTGVDLVRAQILIAEGYPLSTPEIGLASQDDLHMNGYAIQCRVTTEDPANNFAPDTGKITAYRSGGGYGVRLDGGNAAAGSVISPYYDSLLVKVTSWDNTFEGACRRATRALSEEHVRGVKTNIPFVTNILAHPAFHAGACHTKFIDDTPELFDIENSRDRATKVLKYIAQIQVDNPDTERHQYDTPRFPTPKGDKPLCGLKQLLDTKGPEAVKQWVLDQKKLLITDTTMRDAHQSLLSTRMRTRDLVKGADGVAEILNDCFSLEMWGGATFDTAYRFLHESPWERLDMLREKIPNIPFQMLLRGSNMVGYANFPDNLVREFVKESARSGIDVFRVFDSLNWIPGMEIAMDEVLKQNKLLEATICYTGDILDPKRDKYTLKYYVDMAKELEKRGAHTLCIKDMSGLLKPYAAKKLVSTLKQEVGLPIHLHTHDTTGNQVAAYLMAAEAGVDIVDCATASLSSLTSQPSLSAVVASLQGQERDTGLDLQEIQRLDNYWADVRLRYASFDEGLRSPTTDIYRYEIPGGQYTNLKPQVESLGLGHQFEEVKEKYSEVNDLLGGVIKVTPSSKMVGDFAIFMVQNKLDRENLLERGKELTFPRSVVDYFKGMMGQSTFPLPQELSKVVLKGEKPLDTLPSKLLPPADFDAIVKKLQKINPNAGLRQAIAYCLYPQVVEDFLAGYETYGDISQMPSDIFFYGMERGESMEMSIEEGKTLMIKYIGPGERNDDGTLELQFELNGSRRNVLIRDPHAEVEAKQIRLASAPRTRPRSAPPSWVRYPVWHGKAWRHRQEGPCGGHCGGHEDGDQRGGPDGGHRGRGVHQGGHLRQGR